MKHLFTATLFAALLLTACGQAGPLVLPDSPEAQQQKNKDKEKSQ